MGRHSDSWLHTKVQEKKLIQTIFSSSDPLTLMEKNLSKQDSLLAQIHDKSYILIIKNYVNQQLKQTINNLKQSILANQNGEIHDFKLLRLLNVYSKLIKNSIYHKESVQTQSYYQSILQWTENNEVIEILLNIIIIQRPQQKQLTGVFYYIKFFVTHLNSYGIINKPLKSLLLESKELEFAFTHTNQKVNKYVHIKNLSSQETLQELNNSYQIAKRINQIYSLNLSENSYQFKGLVTKLKLILFKDRNSATRIAFQGHHIFFIIDIVFLKSEGAINFPSIFSLPPSYGKMFSEILQTLFQQRSDNKTNLKALQVFDKTLQIQSAQFLKSYQPPQVLILLADENPQIIYDILADTLRYLDKENPLKIKKSAIEDLNFLKLIIKLIADRVSDAKQLFNSAEVIGRKIFETTSNFHDIEIIQNAGKILIGFQTKDQSIVQMILNNIEKNPKMSSPYIRILNNLYASKASRQRRDLGYIARSAAQSSMFSHILPQIQLQIKQNKINSKSTTIQIIKLISYMCSQSPILVDQIQSQDNIITKIMYALIVSQNMPKKTDDIITIINFLHHICLRQGPIRKLVLDQPFEKIIFNLITQDYFISSMLSKGYNFIFYHIKRFIDNIQQESPACVIAALHAGLNILLDNYSEIQKQTDNLINLTNEKQIQCVQKLSKNDQKLAILLKILDKVKQDLFRQCPNQTLFDILTSLQSLIFGFKYAMNDLHFQDRLLVALIMDIKKILKIDKKTLENQAKNSLEVIEQENQRQQDDDRRYDRQVNQPIFSQSMSERIQGRRTLQKVEQTQQQAQIKKEFEKKQRQFIKQSQENAYKKVKQLMNRFSELNKEYKPKQIIIPRKFQQLVLNQQYTSENIWQIHFVHMIPILQRYLHNLMRNITIQRVQKRLDVIYEIYEIYAIGHQIIAKTNGMIMEQNIEKFGNNILQLKVVKSSFAQEKRIIQGSLSKQIHLKIVQSLTPVQYFVDTIVKFSFFTLTQLPQSSTLHKNFNKHVIIPHLNTSRIFLETLKGKSLQQITFYEIDQIRFTVRILNQFFCVLDIHKKRKIGTKNNVFYPMNHMIINHFFFLPENGYSVLDYLSDALNIFTPLILSAKDQYIDSLEDKKQCLKLTMSKIMMNRLKLFIQQFKQKHSQHLCDPKARQSSQLIKNDSISKAYYVNNFMHQKVLNFLIKQPLYPKKNYINNGILVETLLGFIYSGEKIDSYTKPSQWVHLIDLPWQEHHIRMNKKQFEQNFKAQTKQILNWIMNNLHCQIPGINYIWFSLISRTTQNPIHQNTVLTKIEKQKVWSLHKQVSKQILIITKQLFPNLKLDLQIKHPVLKKQINYQKVDIAKSVQKLCNLLCFVINQIKFFKIFQLFDEGKFIIKSNYIRSIILLAENIIDNYSDAQENHQSIAQQANDLSLIIMILLKQYLSYKRKIQQHALQKKKQQKKKKRKLKKELKKSKRNSKKIQNPYLLQNKVKSEKIQDKKQNRNQSQKIKDKNNKKKGKKRQNQTFVESASQVGESSSHRKTLKRNKSTKNLNEDKIISSSKQQPPSLKNKKKKLKSKLDNQKRLDQQVTSYIKTIFEVAEKHAFLSNKTMQAILKTINQSIYNKLNDQNKQTKHFQIDGEMLIKSIFRVKLKDCTNQGLFFQMCQFMVHFKQSSPLNNKVNQQMLIKRFFFERLPKKQIQISEFQQYFLNYDQQISFFASIVQLSIKGQKPEDNQEKILEFNIQNLKSSKNKKKTFVKLKKGLEFNTLICVQKQKKSKTSKQQLNQQEESALRILDYVPEGGFQSFVDQILQNMIRIFVRDIHKTNLQTNNNKIVDQHDSQEEKKAIDAFTLNSLLKILQVVLRLSPSLIPYTIKFKCKQIAKKYFESHNCKLKSCKHIQILGFKNNTQFNFLQFLCRFASPVSINISSSLLMQYCFDNIPLHVNKGQATTFAQITRKKVYTQIQRSIKSDDILIKILGLNTLTNLLLIKKFAEYSIENGIINLVRQQYMKIAQNNQMYKYFILSYFIKPMQLLHQLSFTIPLMKKNKQNEPQIKINKSLDRKSIISQLLSRQYFQKDKFMIKWPHAQNIQQENQQQQQQQEQYDEQSIQDSIGNQQISNPYDQQNSIGQIQGDQQQLQSMVQQQSRNSWLRDHRQLEQQINEIQMQQFSGSDSNDNQIEIIQQSLDGDQIQLDGMLEDDQIDISESDRMDEELNEQISEPIDGIQQQDSNLDSNSQDQNQNQLQDQNDVQDGNQNQYESYINEIPGSSIFSIQNREESDLLSSSQSNYNMIGNKTQKQMYKQFYRIIMDFDITVKDVPIHNYDQIQLRNIIASFIEKDQRDRNPNYKLKNFEIQPFLVELSKSASFDICKRCYFDQFFRFDNDQIGTFAKPLQDPLSLNVQQQEPIQRIPTNLFGAQRQNFHRRHGVILGSIRRRQQNNQMQALILNQWSNNTRLNQQRLRMPISRLNFHEMFAVQAQQRDNERQQRNNHNHNNNNDNDNNQENNNLDQQNEGNNNLRRGRVLPLPMVRIVGGIPRLIQAESLDVQQQNLDIDRRVEQFLRSISMPLQDFRNLPTQVRNEILSQFQTDFLRSYQNNLLMNQNQGNNHQHQNNNNQNQNILIQDMNIEEQFNEDDYQENNSVSDQYDQQFISQQPNLQNNQQRRRSNQRGHNMNNNQNNASQQNLAREIANQQNFINNLRNNLNLQQNLINRNQNNVPHNSNENSNQKIEQNNQKEQSFFQQSLFFQKYHKVCSQFTKKISKDTLQSAIRLNKTINHKFFKVSDQFIETFFIQLYQLNQKTHTFYPYKLVESLCIQHQNSLKIFSTLLAILKLGPQIKIDPQQMNKYKVPQTIIKGLSNQIISNYNPTGFSSLALKIIHIFKLMFKHSSFCTLMLQEVSQPLNPEVLKKPFDEKQSFLQGIISLLNFNIIRKDQRIQEFLIQSIFNIVHNNYSKNIHTLFQKQLKQDKTQKQSKQKINLNRQIDFSIIQNDKKIELSQKAISLICNLYFSEDGRNQYSIISKIIIRLCLNNANLKLFMNKFKETIIILATEQIKILNEYKNRVNENVYQNNQEQNKIVRLMTIIGQIEKQMSYNKMRKQQIYQQFVTIASSQIVQKLCQTGIDMIQNISKSNSFLYNKVNNAADCFFFIYKMAMDNIQTPKQDKKEHQINIAQLGQISFEKNISQQEAMKKKEQKYQNRQKIIIGSFNLDQLWQKKICTVAGRSFINSSIKRKIKNAIKYKINKITKNHYFDIPILAIALRTPHMLQFQNKKALFKVQVRKLKNKDHDTMQVFLNRERVFEQSFRQFMTRRPQDIKKRIKIQFENEQGQDAGGVTRQWFQILSKQMFNPNYALFKPSSTGNTFQPSAFSYVNGDHLQYFKFIGRVMGKALFDGYLLDAYFTPAFYKHILSLPITYQDMEQQDYEYYNSLKWILENSPIQNYLDLDFTYQHDNFGETQTRQLIHGGKDIKVTEQNKIQYVQLVSYAKMALSVKSQLQALLQGFHQLIPRKLIQIFDSKELQIMISGLPSIDIADLKRNTDFVNYRKDDNIIVWLFEVLEDFNEDLRTSFLQFVTGTSRVPSQGFKGLRGFNGPQKFNIHKMFDTSKLPRAHTCFNQLDLPNYPSKQILIQKLSYAITQCKQGFGFV